MARACAGAELIEVDSSLGTGLGPGRDGAGLAGYYLATDDPRAVGRAVQWAAANDAERVEILAERGAADLARRAGLLDPGSGPAVAVWDVDGADVTSAVAAPAAVPPPIPPSHWALAGVMTEAGARPLDDHGQLVAEVAGLEVGRVVDDGHGPLIDVGVGQADRELAQLVHREPDPGAGLRRVIAAVADYRRPGSHHPLTRVGRERWLRSVVLEDPGLVGADALEPVVPLRPRTGLRRSEPAAAGGPGASGRPLLVVTMVGADLDLVPEAADYRQRWDPSAELVIAVPERDLPLSTGLLDRVSDARAVALPTPWLASV